MRMYSVAVVTPHDHYMTAVEADDAQEVFRILAMRVDRKAEEASLEILEVLEGDR